MSDSKKLRLLKEFNLMIDWINASRGNSIRSVEIGGKQHNYKSSIEHEKLMQYAETPLGITTKEYLYLKYVKGFDKKQIQRIANKKRKECRKLIHTWSNPLINNGEPLSEELINKIIIRDKELGIC